MSADFATVEAVRPGDFNRDGWKRPLIIPIGGGKPKAYTRTTTYIGAIEEYFAINQWERRMVAIGLAKTPALQLAVLAHRNDKTRLNEITSEAKTVAGGEDAATIGTAMHAFTEQVDRGEDLTDIDLGPYTADLAAYIDKTAVLSCIEIEQHVVLDAFEIAGTPDRVVSYQGKRYIADLKTSSSLNYGTGKMACQLACYARSRMYDVGTGERTPHGADLTRGLIIWLPAGQARCELLWIDLEAGWEGVKLARQVRDWRKRRYGDLCSPFDAIDVPVLPDVAAAIKACNTIDGLTAVWNKYQDYWTDELTVLSRETKAAIQIDLDNRINRKASA